MAADAEIRNGTTKKNPAIYFQESNKNHADTLAAAKLAEIVSFTNPRKKSKHENEAKLLAQDEKLTISHPPEKKGLPPTLTYLYNAFKSVGTNDNDLKVSLWHTQWGKHSLHSICPYACASSCPPVMA